MVLKDWIKHKYDSVYVDFFYVSEDLTKNPKAVRILLYFCCMIEVETYLPGKDNNRKDDQVFCSLTVLLDIPLVNPGEAQEPPGEGPKETKVGTWSETKENNMVGTLYLCITSS